MAIDFISRYHTKFNLANESFFQFIMIFNKVVDKIQICKYDIKIIAVACFLIASKFEQSYIPSLRHYVQILEE